MGSPYREYKRKIIKFGQSKYILVYFLDVMADELYVVAIYHGKEDPTHPEHGDYDDASGFDDD